MAKGKDKTISEKLEVPQKVKTFKKVAKPVDNVPIVSKQRYNYRRATFVVFLIVIFVAFSILTFLVKMNPHNGIDLSITRELQKFHPVWFQMLMNAITFIGNNLNAAILTAIVAGYFFFKRRVKEGVMTIVSPLGASIISVTLKALVHRPRPDPKLIHQIGTFRHDDSFPSGHVLFYVGFFGFLLYLAYTLPPENRYRSFFLVLLILLLLLIGPSRIFVGAHWFSDTLGSYLIGFIWLSFTTYVYNRWTKQGKEL